MSQRSRVIQNFLPLSPLQEGLLFHHQLTEGADLYVGQVVLELADPVDVSLVRRAAQALLERHDSLRACFRSRKSGELAQLIAKSSPLAWQETSAASAADSERLVDAERERRFDLARPPLLRFVLIRVDSGYRLVLTFHHIVLDGWSLPVLVREFLALYRQAELPRARPYGDYLTWLDVQDRDAALVAWRDTLRDIEGPTLVAPEVSGQPVLPEQVHRELSEVDTTRLVRWARSNELTLNTVVQGIWGVALGGFTGRDDVVTGMTVSGRPPELDGADSMVGMFVNTVPLRISIDPREKLVALLQRLQSEQSALLPHQHVGLTDILGGAKLFDTLCAFQNYPSSRSTVEGEPPVTTITDRGNDATHYPLTFIVGPGRTLRFHLDYRPDALDRASVESLADQVRRLFTIAVDSADTPLGRIQLLGDDERARLRKCSEGPSDLADVVATIPELFESQARRTPENTAVVCRSARLSYTELNEASNRLAHDLIDRGMGPGSVVALLLPREMELVLAVLGVLKSGAAYLPLDVLLPNERIRYQVGDASATVLLTVRSQAARLPDDLPADVVVLDDPELLARCPATAVARTVPLLPQHPAYVIYTSGSTGAPKGVVVTHENVVRLMTATERHFGFAETDVWTLFHSYAFDFSVWELWGALLYGGTLIVVSHTVSRSPQEFLALLASERVTFLNQTPSAFYQLAQADAENPGHDLALRHVVLGGEALEPARLADWYSRHTDDAPLLSNMYGITETTVHVSYLALGKDVSRSMIGKPLAGLSAYVLDDNLRLVAPGLTGELYIAGSGLAQGYLNQPGRTASRFVANPFGTGRLYRTGDLARRTEGGLEYVGRSDHQVKVRGFRIEPGEVEAKIVAQPSVTDAAVVLREITAGDHGLVAYLIGEQVDVPVLRDRLEAVLPEYMVPAAFVVLDAFPLTVNGKLDRQALPAPKRSASDSSRAARDPREELVCQLFAEVFGVASVGVDDNFFRLGGHSLIAVRLAGRIRSALNAEVSVRQVFDNPTPAQLAACLDGAR